jgi:AcrR family transcriptional regulator
MPRTKVLANRQQLILDSARALFGRYGFEKTTVEDVAKQAGISKGAIYLEFSDKSEIFVAIVKQFKDIELSRMNVQIADSRPPILPKLNEMLLDHIMRVFDHATSQIHAPESLLHIHKLVVAKIGFTVVLRDLIVQMLEKARKNNEIIKGRDSVWLADLLMANIATLMPPYPRNTTVFTGGFLPRDEFEKNATELLAIFLAGMTVKR